MFKALIDSFGRRKFDKTEQIAPAPVRKADKVLGNEIPGAPNSDGAGTLTTLDDPWEELMKRADEENMSPKEYNEMILDHYHPDMHRAMIIREATRDQFTTKTTTPPKGYDEKGMNG